MRFQSMQIVVLVLVSVLASACADDGGDGESCGTLPKAVQNQLDYAAGADATGSNGILFTVKPAGRCMPLDAAKFVTLGTSGAIEIRDAAPDAIVTPASYGPNPPMGVDYVFAGSDVMVNLYGPNVTESTVVFHRGDTVLARARCTFASAMPSCAAL